MTRQPGEPRGADPFARVHRRGRSRRVLGACLAAVGVAAVVLVLCVATSAARTRDITSDPVAPVADATGSPGPAAAGSPQPAPTPQDTAPPGSEGAGTASSPPGVSAPKRRVTPAPNAAPAPSSPAGSALEVPGDPAAAEPSAPPPPAGPSGPLHIDITAEGNQGAVNECQWVRVDLVGVPVPFVAAHTACGGAPVLNLHRGDPVELAGLGLDGAYRVTDGRDAHAGDDAVTATAGMDAAVILQSCYLSDDGAVRLVSLARAEGAS